jgi:vacuolar protein sorting-associated protein VTA1
MKTSDKIKYAKFQCARILKAIKAGEDPNAATPEEEEEALPIMPYVSPNRTSHPSIQSPPVDGTIPPNTQPMKHGPSPQSPDSPSFNPPNQPSFQGSDTISPKLSQMNLGTFQPPSSFSPDPRAAPTTLPLQPSTPTTFPPSLPLNSNTSSQISGSPPNQFSPVPPPRPPPFSSPHNQDLPANYYTSQSLQQRPPPPPPPVAPPPSNYYTQPSAPSHQSGPFQPSTQSYQPTSSYQPPAPQPSPSYFPPQPQVVVDDEAIAKAQKHARWAISALNYDDVETAVKELKNALNTLGVRN